MATPDPLEDIAFLARSAHRVQVLQTLADGPMTRPALHEETGISQPTLGRILEPFQNRNWVERRGQEYAVTPWGELLVDEFDGLLDTVETIQRVGHVVKLLPTDQMTFDIRRFGYATVTTPQTGDVLRHVRRAEERLSGADHVRIVADTIVPQSLEDQRDRVVNASGNYPLIESVITKDALEQALAEPQLVNFIRDLLGSGQAPVYCYDGTILMMGASADDIAILAPTDEQGMPGAIIETEDEVIRAWVDEQFDAYKDKSMELTVDDLPL
ncbi:helix-turn-helix transcriptional regulator [Haladaptatus sp. DFWS20]|uniref:helix-turn-helix transcriptional regulator n=1 Tax=Haladaptatus sp. DFWS20 TaxID=3403467 RepID=UPI003EBE9451